MNAWAAHAESAVSATLERRLLLSRCLTHPFAGSRAPFESTLRALSVRGGVPFEAIAGTPSERYGVRVTLRCSAETRALAAASGLLGHPWGIPDWIGLRVSPEGEVRFKGYHRHGRYPAPFVLPRGLPEGLLPVMAALDGDATEFYLRLGPAVSWQSFAAIPTALVGAPEYRYAPLPRPTRYGYCLSLRWQDERLSAVTLYADGRALPDDRTICRVWSEALDPKAREVYELALAGVRALGRPSGRSHHALLGWTFEEGRAPHRAVSLRIPPP